MMLYEFTDTSGVVRSIKDIQGRHVLMNVWASWCAPCLRSMPDIKSLADDAGSPVTVVGINIDEDPEKAKALATKNGWNWSQNYLGDGSDMARQLAISSVPVYFLIGPDGNLISSASEWSVMKKQLQTALADEK